MEKNNTSGIFISDIAAFFLLLGSSAIIFLAVDLLFSALSLIVGGHIGAWQAATAFVLTIPLIGWFASFVWPKRWVVGTVMVVVIFFGLFYALALFEGHFTDVSYDGQAYHQTAIIKLVEGWNPFYERVSAEELGTLARWVNHYPKGSWYLAASLYQLFGDIEMVKVFNGLAVGASLAFLLALFFGMKRFPVVISVLLSLAIAFNPIVLTQWLSYYIDGALYALLVSLGSLLAMYHLTRRSELLPLIGFVLIILINVKFTAVVYAAIVMFLGLLLPWLHNNIQESRRLFFASMFATVVGVIIVGFNPYVTNTIFFGHPFFPLAGAQAINLKPYNVPGNYVDKPAPEILFLSVFSEATNDRGEGTAAHLKWPFVIKAGELDMFSGTSVKAGGFGPLFGGAFLMALFVLVGAVASSIVRPNRLAAFPFFSFQKRPVRERHQRYERLKPIFFLMGFVLLSAIINPIASLARYVPHLWVFPALAVVLAYSCCKHLVIRSFATAIVLVMLLNSGLVAREYASANVAFSHNLGAQMAELKQRSEAEPLHVYFGEFEQSTRHKLDADGIRFVEVAHEEDCQNGHRILEGNITLLCQSEHQ